MGNLDEHFNRLTEALSSWGFPDWENVLFAEGLYVDIHFKQSISKSELLDISNFAPKFDTLMSEGHSWIHMSALGLIGDTLIVGIEKSSATFEGCRTSVNLSGAQNFVIDNNYNIEKFVEISE